MKTVERGLDLMCGPMHSIRIDFDKHHAVVKMRADTCVNMMSAVRFFESVDPDVRHIETWAGDQLDTQYVRIDGKWSAIANV